jgi:hypothetical protein
MEQISEDTIIKLIKFLKSHPKYRDQLAELFDPGEFVRRDELTTLLEEIKQLRIESDKRFNDSNKRFDALQQQIDKNAKDTNKRFDALQQQIDKNARDTDKRFNAMQEQMDKRFDAMQEQMDKRFNAFQEQMDKRFDKVFERFDEFSIALGHDFEEFNSLWLQDYLRVQGFPKLKIKKVTIYDENYEVFPDSTEVELDVFNEKPFIIGEITAITKNIDKVNLFLRKVEFMKKRNKTDPQLFYVTYGFKPQIRDKALELLEKANVKVFTVRQKDVENLA